MKHHDFIPARDSDFDEWFLNLKNYVSQKTSGQTPEWAFIPQAEVTELGDRYNAWHAAYEATIPPHASPLTDAKNEERVRAEDFIRIFVNRYLRFPPVTNSDRDAMRIHNRDAHPTRVEEPRDPPEWSVRSNGLYRVRFDIRPAGAETAHIPDGYNGAVVNYAITGEPVTDVSLLTRKALLHKGLSDMQFTQAEDGKYLSASLEWETHTNLHGPKSEVQSIKIR